MQFRSLDFLPKLPIVEKRIVIGGRIYSLLCVDDEESLLEQSERFAEFPFGCLLWESAVALAALIESRREEFAPKRILEIGAGTGLVGLVAAANGLNLTQTDHLPEALELCRRNAERNGIAPPTSFLHDWRDWTHAPKYDLILGADVLYQRAFHPALETVFETALAPGGTVLLADPQRPQALEFVAAREAAGWDFEFETVTAQLPGRAPVEITIYEGRRG